MDTWIEKLRSIKIQYGFPLDKITPITLDIPKLTISDKKRFSFFYGFIYNEKILLVTVDDMNMSRVMKLKFNIESALNKNQLVIFVFSQLNNKDRKRVLSNGISFITLEGESFIPNLNVNLHPITLIDESINMTLSTMGQRLFMFIVSDMLSFEKRGISIVSNGNESLFSCVVGGMYRFKGGAKFINSIGKKLGIKNRTSFNRAIKDLIQHNVLKTRGETKEKEYIVTFNSRKLFMANQDLLQRPIKEKDIIVPRNENIVPYIKDSLLSSDSALSKNSMISYDGPDIYVAGSAIIQDISENFKSDIRVVNDRNVLNYADSGHVIFQEEKYELKIFSEMLIKFLDFSQNSVDPLHLFLLFKNSQDDRILSEIDYLLERVWSS